MSAGIPRKPDTELPPSDPREFRQWLAADEGRRAEMLDLLSPIQVAAQVRVSVATLANWRSARRGPRFVKIGSSIWYRRCDVLAFIAGNLIGTTSQPLR